jgi:hypothetical protein
MRTMLTIDDGIARALKDLAHRSGKPFKQVVNETPRAGLGAPEARWRKPYPVKPVALGGVLPGVNPGRALALARRDRGSGACGQAAAAQVILVDANLLIDAIDSDSPQHRATEFA